MRLQLPRAHTPTPPPPTPAPQMDFVKLYPHAADAATMDGSFTSTVFDLNALMGHVPEAGGMAAPLFFLMTTGARDGTPGLQTDLIRWGLRQFAEVTGLGLPQILLADKELAEQNAWSIAAHEALESVTARDERLALVDVLRAGGASASLAHINAARRIVAVLGAAGAAAPRAAEAPLAGEGEGATTAPRAAEAPLAWPLLADVLLEPAAAETPLISDTVVALFHADIVTQFKPLLVRLRDALGQTLHGVRLHVFLPTQPLNDRSPPFASSCSRISRAQKPLARQRAERVPPHL